MSSWDEPPKTKCDEIRIWLMALNNNTSDAGGQQWPGQHNAEWKTGGARICQGCLDGDSEMPHWWSRHTRTQEWNLNKIFIKNFTQNTIKKRIYHWLEWRKYYPILSKILYMSSVIRTLQYLLSLVYNNSIQYPSQKHIGPCAHLHHIPPHPVVRYPTTKLKIFVENILHFGFGSAMPHFLILCLLTHVYLSFRKKNMSFTINLIILWYSVTLINKDRSLCMYEAIAIEMLREFPLRKPKTR